MKADLHAHTKFSKRPSIWILQKIGCRESYIEPAETYRRAKARGMDLVTITDHNTIDGALEIADRPDVFVGEEVTTYFPENQRKVHVLVYGVDEATHRDIAGLRRNIYELVDYLNRNGVVHGVAHPFFSVDDRLTIDDFEKMLLLFRRLELNGDQCAKTNGVIRLICESLTAGDVEFLSDKHNLEPAVAEPWRKVLIGGSDDHASLHVGARYTEVPGARNADEFLAGLEPGRADSHGLDSTPLATSLRVYSIAYQFYRDKVQLGAWAKNNILMRFFDRALLDAEPGREGVLSRVGIPWGRLASLRDRFRKKKSLLDLLRVEAERQIRGDADLLRIVRDGRSDGDTMGKTCFDFVSRVSNRVMADFSTHCLDRLFGARLFDLFHSIGSAAALYSMLAPYFATYARYGRERAFAGETVKRFPSALRREPGLARRGGAAYFADALPDSDDLDLRWIAAARRAGADGSRVSLTVVSCGEAPASGCDLPLKEFRPVGVYKLPDMAGVKLRYPPFLEMLEYCHDREFGRVFAATPGPVGLAALGVARTLKVPIEGAYNKVYLDHAQANALDSDVGNVMWRFLIWFYEQLDGVHAPSPAAADELLARGLTPLKIRVAPAVGPAPPGAPTPTVRGARPTPARLSPVG